MNLKKLVAPAVLSASLLFGASPSFAYNVEAGDTLSEIATKHNMNLNELVALNPQVKNINLIYVGDNINTNKNQVTNVNSTVSTKVNTGATPEERELLAKLVEAEAKGEPYAGKVAVAYVVLNRVDSPDFPNTIKEVIYQKGQFSPVSNGAINSDPTAETYKAVDEALVSDRSFGAGSLFFYNPAIATSRWLDSRPTTTVIGNHVFKK